MSRHCVANYCVILNEAHVSLVCMSRAIDLVDEVNIGTFKESQIRQSFEWNLIGINCE